MGQRFSNGSNATPAAAGAQPQRRLTDEEAMALLRSPPATTNRAEVLEDLVMEVRLGLVKRAVEEGVVSPTSHIGLTGDFECDLVHVAATKGDLGLLRCLIVEHGIEPNPRTSKGDTPLIVALNAKMEAAALWLINECPGVDLEAPIPNDGRNVLMAAASNGLVEVLRALVAKVVDIERRGGELGRGAMTALGWAIATEQEAAALYLLQEAGASWDVGGLTAHLDRALINAGGNRKMAMDAAFLTLAATANVPRVIKHGIRQMRVQGVRDQTVRKFMTEAAITAALCGKVRVLEALWEAGGLGLVRLRVKVGGVPGQGLLHLAAQGGHQEAAAYLLDLGCDPLQGERGAFKLMPYFGAVCNGHLAFMQWFAGRCPVILEAMKIDPRIVSAAVRSGNLEMVKWVMELGADPRPSFNYNGEQRTAIQLAQQKGHADIVAYLREHEEARAARAAARARVEAAVKAELEAREAAARAEQEAAARIALAAAEQAAEKVAAALAAEAAVQAEREEATHRARNEKRRQKQKKAKARRRAAGAPEDEEEAVVEAALAGLGVGGEGGVAKAGQQQDDRKPAAPSAIPAEEEVEQPPSSPSLPPERPPPLEEFVEMDAPDGLLCPLTLELFKDPVVLFGDGITYSRAAIQQHIDYCHDHNKPVTSPSTNLPFNKESQAMLAPNVMARGQVSDYRAVKKREWEELE